MNRKTLAATEYLVVRDYFFFSLKLRRTGAIGPRPRRIGLGFANITVLAGSSPNEHTVTRMNTAAHLVDFRQRKLCCILGLSTLLSFTQPRNSLL
jgi:hypothetical protein